MSHGQARTQDLLSSVETIRSTQSATLETGGPYRQFGKRSFDLAVGLILTLLCAPILLGVWLLLRITLGPNVILTQQRVGRYGQPFGLYKFRTMEQDRREAQDGDPDQFGGQDRRGSHKSTNDPRHTPVGRIVRRFSLDELPQLINICKGDMSLVGPRPELMSVASPKFRAHARHQVRPGLTGPYQVSEMRRAGNLNDGLALDAAYVENLSAGNDLRYLLATAGVVRRGTGS